MTREHTPGQRHSHCVASRLTCELLVRPGVELGPGFLHVVAAEGVPGVGWNRGGKAAFGVIKTETMQ